MKRIRNWDIRLLEWSLEVLGEEFEWGRTDCGTLTWNALHAMYDSCRPLGSMPYYEHERGALQAFSTHGGPESNLMSIGAEVVDRAFAQNGDVICYNPDRGPQAAAVVVDGCGIVASPEEGVYRVPVRSFSEDATFLRVPYEVE